MRWKMCSQKLLPIHYKNWLSIQVANSSVSTTGPVTDCLIGRRNVCCYSFGCLLNAYLKNRHGEASSRWWKVAVRWCVDEKGLVQTKNEHSSVVNVHTKHRSRRDLTPRTSPRSERAIPRVQDITTCVWVCRCTPSSTSLVCLFFLSSSGQTSFFFPGVFG